MIELIGVEVVVVYWIGFAILCGVAARNKGHSVAVFILLSLALSPLFGYIALLSIKANHKKIEKDQLLTGNFKRCPHCVELVKSEAKVCRYCNSDISNVEAPAIITLSPEVVIEKKTLFGDDRQN